MDPHKPLRWRPARWLLFLLLPLLIAACAGARTPSTSWPGLAADDRAAYVAVGPSVLAVDLADGAEKWRFPRSDEEAVTSYYAVPALAEDGVLYVGSYDGDIVALNADSGTVRWRKVVTAGRVIGGPAIAGDLLLVPSSDRTLYAIDRQDGREVWTFQTERPLWATPLVEGDRVFLAGLDHHLYSLAADSGRLLWEREFDGALADRPSSFNGVLLVGTFGQELHAVDRETGATQWTVATDNWVWGNPAVGDDAAFFGDVDGDFYAVDRQGRILWQTTLGSEVAASPAYDQGRLYLVTAGGGVFARQALENDPVWEHRIDGRLLADPVLSEDLLLVAALEGDDLLTAYNAESGAVRWTYQLAED